MNFLSTPLLLMVVTESLRVGAGRSQIHINKNDVNGAPVGNVILSHIFL